MSARQDASSDRTDGSSRAGPATPPLASVPASAPDRTVDPRSVRVALGPVSAHAGAAPIVIEPPPGPLAPPSRIAGSGVLDGAAPAAVVAAPDAAAPGGFLIVDGSPMQVRLDRLGPIHGVLVEGRDEPTRTNVLVMAPDGSGTGIPGGVTAGREASGIVRREIVVDGWRIEVRLESERRASLRERARRGRADTAHGGPTEVHAIIPGVVVSVAVAPGDAVVAGQNLLVVEAMKMQNEIRAPRDGVVTRVAVGPGVTIEVGDLLLVLE